MPAFDATLAQFNRVYNQGKKNHFTLLGSDEIGKFNLIYGLNGSASGQEHFKNIMDNIDNDDDFCDEDESKATEDDASLIEKLGIEPEDVHGPSKVVLQRQFFEVIVRAAYIKYNNNADLPTLADKLDHMFKTKLVPNATKTKIKSSDEEKNFKLAEGVIDEYEQLWTVFEYFGKQSTTNNLQKDATLTVGDLLNMFYKAKILDSDRISTSDFIDIIEKYHANGSGAKLSEKLSDACFRTYLKANACTMQINIDCEAIMKHNAACEDHNSKIASQQEQENPPQPMELKECISEEDIKSRTESETAEMQSDW